MATKERIISRRVIHVFDEAAIDRILEVTYGKIIKRRREEKEALSQAKILKALTPQQRKELLAQLLPNRE